MNKKPVYMTKKELTYLTETGKKSLSKIDFSDTFSITNHSNTIKEITLLVFGKSPKFIKFLFKLRNSIVKLIGLRTPPIPDTSTFIVGGNVNFFEIYSISENEVLLGANDSHLNFRAIVYNTKEKEYNIKVTTLVEYNNKIGRIYMFLIKPFHQLIVRRMINQACENN